MSAYTAQSAENQMTKFKMCFINLEWKAWILICINLDAANKLFHICQNLIQ